MIEMASSHRITKVSRVFPWAYTYTSRVGRVWPRSLKRSRDRPAHGRANYRNEAVLLEIRTDLRHLRAEHGAGDAIPGPGPGLDYADYPGARWRRVQRRRAELH